MTRLEGLAEGRIVHYVLRPGEHRAAIIVRVWRDSHGNPAPLGTVNLTVFPDWGNDGEDGIVWKTSVVYDEAHGPYTWHWPERE
jgi:hypothetical protein